MSRPALNEESRKYWQNRIELHDKKVEKDTLKLEKQLKKLFVDTSKEIKKELAYFYANNTNIGNYENYRLEATLQAIYIALDTLFNKEEEKLNKRLVEAYIDTYKYFDNLLNINASFETINIGLVEQVVKTNTDYTYTEITPIFTRNIPANDSETVSMIKQLYGIVSDETLLAQLPFVEDVQKEIEAIEEKKSKEAINYDIFSNEEVIDNE